MLSFLFNLTDIFDESLLVHEASVLAVPDDADESEPKLDKTLIDKVHGRMNIERNRSLRGSNQCVVFSLWTQYPPGRHKA